MKLCNKIRLYFLWTLIPFLFICILTIDINYTNLNSTIIIQKEALVCAEEQGVSSQGISETKKILEQIDLIDKTLELEKKEITDIEAYLGDIKSKTAEFDSATNVYKIELGTFANQLHLPEVETKIIEKAYMSSQASSNKVTQELLKLKDKREQITQALQVSYEQKTGNDKFLMELKNNAHKSGSSEQGADLTQQSDHGNNSQQQYASGSKQAEQTNQTPQKSETLSSEQQQPLVNPQLVAEKQGDPQQRAALEARIAMEEQLAEEQQQKAAEQKKIADEKREALKRLQIRLQLLQTSLTKKILLMQSVEAIIDSRIPVLEEIEAKYKSLVGELEIRIRDSKKSELLTRKTNPLIQGTWTGIRDEVKELFSTFSSILDIENWKNSFNFLWLSGLHKLLSFIAVLLMLAIIAIRLKIFIKRTCELSVLFEKRYWSKTTLEIFGHNLLLSAITAFFYMCIKFKLFFSYSIVANLIVEIMIFLVFILWMIDFCEQIEKRYPVKLLKNVIIFLQVLNLVAIIYIMLGSTLKSDSSIVTAYRLICEILFYAWTIRFFKQFMPEITLHFEQQKKNIKMLPAFYKNAMVIIAISGMVLELLGYGTLAIYWYISWGKTMVVLTLSGLIIGASGEWIPGVAQSSQQAELPHIHQHTSNSFSMLWLIKQISFIILFFLVTIALMLSWASSDFVFPTLYNILTYKVIVGSMNFSILSIIQAVTLLIITHFIAKSWRHFFQKNFLGKSGLDQGLQESMTTITVYSIWIFGIFMALIIFGLNTTTLTVAFGALSIGLGFGLQNIFSNFISGIILLFERPIQVGDDIEVNGLWANVRKTNVRSTVVQTYDNATIIIPNSELISNRVTNWSFKDKRLRRKIKIGVEYGSDIELVRTTLLEIASKTQKVLKYPEPDVLFEDFGDSALIFTLRFWTFIDYFLTVETDIRFKINKLFMERGLVIAFPQQDINIKSIPSNLMIVPKISDSGK